MGGKWEGFAGEVRIAQRSNRIVVGVVSVGRETLGSGSEAPLKSNHEEQRLRRSNQELHFTARVRGDLLELRC